MLWQFGAKLCRIVGLQYRIWTPLVQRTDSKWERKGDRIRKRERQSGRRSTCRSTSHEVISSDMIRSFERLFMHCLFRGPKVSKKSEEFPAGLEFENLCSQLLWVFQLWEHFHNFVYVTWVKNCMKILPDLLSLFLESAGLWHG